MTASVFAARFEEHLGAERIASILARIGDSPTILLAGDPGTGKSAVAARIAAATDRAASGTGAIVRARATAAGMTLVQYNRHLESHPEKDLALDARAAEVIAGGEVVVFESRLAGHLGTWLRARGRRGLTSISLRCEPREQACRLLAREASPRVREEIQPLLSNARGLRVLDDCVEVLRLSSGSDVAEAISVLEAQASRTATDRARLLVRYGVTLDDASAYDLVLDTSRTGVFECAAKILHAGGITSTISRDLTHTKR